MLRKVAFLLSLMLVVIAPLLATPLVAQVDVSVDAVWYLQLLGVALPFVLPLMNRYVWEGIEQVIPWLEGLPKWPKRLLIAVQSELFVLLSVSLGIQLPATLSGFTQETSLALLAAIAAFGIHKAAKDKERAARPT